MKRADLKGTKIASMLRKFKIPFWKDNVHVYNTSMVESFDKEEKEWLSGVIANRTVFKLVEVYKQYLADCSLQEMDPAKKMMISYEAMGITSFINFWNDNFCKLRKQEVEEAK